MTPLRRVVAVLLVISAVVAVFFAFTGDPTASGAAPAPAGATPVWSPRRVPQPFSDAVGAQHLQGALDTEVGSPSTCVMVEDGSTILAASNVDTPLLPASAQKLLVAAAALETMGPDFRYETKVVAPAAAQDGTVDQLVMVGSGDPVIESSDYVDSLATQPRRKGGVVTSLEMLANQIVASGVKRVRNGIVGDDSRYDQQRTVAGWSPSYLADGDVGPLGALTVNDGLSSFNPPHNASDPAVNAASKLTDLLVAQGVQVGGTPSHGVAPQNAVEITKIASPSLRDIVGSMLTTSDALTAELLAKELGVRASNDGSTAAGTAAIVASLKRLGLPVDGLALMDASGLHRGNRATCRTLLATLQLGSQPPYDALWSGLSVVGVKGTLIDQLLGLGLEGKLAGKTGFLSGVTSLVGKLDDDSTSRHLQFAFIDNGDYGQTASEALRRDAVQVLDTFPDAPAAEQLVPAPA
jgi:D-alanyl-D-alanine carboxypeptidase/D-alanyl-D-alanine-endopeptidase (penicillin-binding protein 4)